MRGVGENTFGCAEAGVRGRLAVAVAVCVVVVCGLMLVAAGSVYAYTIHGYVGVPLLEEVPVSGPHGESIPDPGPLHELGAMSIDEGHVWAAEKGGSSGSRSRIDEWSAVTGQWMMQTVQPALVLKGSPESVNRVFGGIAVAHLAASEAQVFVGGVQAANGEGMVAVFDGSTGGQLAAWTGAGTPAGKFGPGAAKPFAEGVAAVAVDGSTGVPGDWAQGDLYVVDPGLKVVNVFKPQAGGGEGYVTQLTGFTEPTRVAVDQRTGEVFVVDQLSSSSAVIDEFTPAALESYTETTVTGVANFLGEPAGGFGRVQALSVDEADGSLLVSEDVGAAAGVVSEVSFASPAAVLLGQITGTPSGSLQPIYSTAVQPADGNVFVGEFLAGRPGVARVFGPGLVAPDAHTSGFSGEHADGSGQIAVSFEGKVDALNAGEASCGFAYGVQADALTQTAPCTGSVQGAGAVAVSAPAVLEPDTAYWFKLQASNANGVNPGENTVGPFTTSGPGLDGDWSHNVASTSASIAAMIDPHGMSASYYVQYGTSSGSLAGQQPSSGTPALVGDGEEEVEVGQHLQGLAPDTTYYYRVAVIAQMPGGGVETFWEPEHSFTTHPVGGSGSVLLDGRAWEMVSPVDPHAARFHSLGVEGGGAIQAAANGTGFTDIADIPSEESPQGYDELMQVLFHRTPQGWGSEDIALPHGEAMGDPAPQASEYFLFSENLGYGVAAPRGPFTPLGTLAFPEATERTPYLRSSTGCAAGAAGCYTPIATSAAGYADVAAGVKFGNNPVTPTLSDLTIEGATEDLQHIMVESSVQLTSTATPGGEGGLYEWSAQAAPANALQLVSVLPSGAAVAGGANLGVLAVGYNVKHAISSDGQRVFWTENAEHHLYMRDVAKAETVQLDVPEPGKTGEQNLGQPRTVFQDASADGSEVFFLDGERLTVNSGTWGTDLYACRMVEEAGRLKCALTDLTPETDGHAAEVQGMILGASQDGSYVYFVAKAVLSSAASPTGEHAIAGGENLYVMHDSEKGWEPARLVAVLSGEDRFDWAETGGAADHLTAGYALTARVSPNGQFVTFMSDRSLTGYDNRDAASGHPDEEVYLYGATGGGSLVCASCNPSGERPTGVEDYIGTQPQGLVDARVPKQTWFAASVPGWTELGLFEAPYQSRYLSGAGRLFFDSTDGLVPGVVAGVEHVFEFEPAGVGGCVAGGSGFSVASDGCVGLVSGGGGGGESAFLDASESGSDVFFLSAANLTGGKSGSGYAIFDAHECTVSSPCVSSTAGSAAECGSVQECRGEGEQGSGSVFAAAASEVFSGQGNLVRELAGAPAKKPVGKHKPSKHKRKRKHKGRGGRVKKKRLGRAHKARHAHNARHARNARRAHNARRAREVGRFGFGVRVGRRG